MSEDWTMVMRLLLACVQGMAIGIEREIAGKPAGFRTHTLVCLGSTLFWLVSVYAFGDSADHARVAAQVVTGIGFLGAGAIFTATGRFCSRAYHGCYYLDCSSYWASDCHWSLQDCCSYNWAYIADTSVRSLNLPNPETLNFSAFSFP